MSLVKPATVIQCTFNRQLRPVNQCTGSKKIVQNLSKILVYQNILLPLIFN